MMIIRVLVAMVLHRTMGWPVMRARFRSDVTYWYRTQRAASNVARINFHDSGCKLGMGDAE